MRSQSIIGQTPALLYQMQIGFTGFEKHLYIPAFPINTDDFFRGDSCVRADDGKPVFSLAFVPDTDDARERPSKFAALQSRFLSSAADRRRWLIGTKELPSDHPSVNIR